jgi:hypothetical protein
MEFGLRFITFPEKKELIVQKPEHNSKYDGVSKNFPNWLSGTRTANGTALCH